MVPRSTIRLVLYKHRDFVIPFLIPLVCVVPTVILNETMNCAKASNSKSLFYLIDSFLEFTSWKNSNLPSIVQSFTNYNLILFTVELGIVSTKNNSSLSYLLYEHLAPSMKKSFLVFSAIEMEFNVEKMNIYLRKNEISSIH